MKFFEALQEKRLLLSQGYNAIMVEVTKNYGDKGTHCIVFKKDPHCAVQRRHRCLKRNGI